MSYAMATSVTLIGITGHLTPVQAEPVAGRPAGIVILSPDGRSLEETRERICAAALNSGLPLLGHRVTVSLVPSNEPPPASSVDLAMAAVILSTGGVFVATALDGVVLIGELGLDGSVRPVRGVLPMVGAAADVGITTVVVPAGNVHEARLVTGVRVVAVDSLQQFVRWASGGIQPSSPQWANQPPWRRAMRWSRIWPTCLPRCRRPGGRWRSPRPAGTIWAWSGRPAAARRCSRGGCRPCCPTSTSGPRWRSRRCARRPGCCHPAPDWCAGHRFRHRTTPPRWRRCSAVVHARRTPGRRRRSSATSRIVFVASSP
jgi:Subunit ChlI of Mg-chelatase